MIYHYRRSRKSVGIRLILWAALLFGWLWIFRLMGAPPDSEFMRWSIIGFSIAAAILLGVALWNFTHPGVYEVKVSNTHLSVRYPESAQWSFDVSIADIECIEHRTRRDHAGRRDIGHFVVCVSGEEYRITNNYFSSIRQILKALRKVKPAIGYEHRHSVRVA